MCEPGPPLHRKLWRQIEPLPVLGRICVHLEMSRPTWIKGCWHFAAGWIWVTKMEQNLRTQKAQGAAHPISVQGPWVSPLLPWITFENQRISAFEHQNQHDKQPADFLGGVWEVRIKKKKRSSPELFHSPPFRDYQRGLWGCSWWAKRGCFI